MDIASYIDHTLLKPLASDAEIDTLCVEAVDWGFAAVCVPPYFVSRAARNIRSSPVKLATVIGFPFGYSTISSKLQEIEQAMLDGAQELDMVVCLAAIKNGNWTYLEKEAKQCLRLIRQEHRIVKLIIESGVLTEAELIRCCELYADLGPAFLKTSTGYAETGATVRAVELMREHLPSSIGIKASGGIRNFAFAKELLDAGASRLGCSASLRILEESKASETGNP